MTDEEIQRGCEKLVEPLLVLIAARLKVILREVATIVPDNCQHCGKPIAFSIDEKRIVGGQSL